MQYFNPPTKLASLSCASESTQALFKEHTLYGVILYEFDKECEGPGILAYCRCSTHTLNPKIIMIPLKDVMILKPLDINKETFANARAS